MVWGLDHSGRFGRFFLDGDFVGWVEAAQDHFDNKMSKEEQLAYMDGALRSASGKAASKFATEAGFLAEFERPKEFRVERKPSEIGSFIKLSDQLTAVDTKLKEIIEKLEPGKHQFWSIKITLPNGELLSDDYFALIVQNHFHSFSPEDTDPSHFEEKLFTDTSIYKPGTPSKFKVRNLLKAASKLAFSKEVFGDAHLWRETRMYAPDFCFSDELVLAIQEADLLTPTLRKMKEV